MALRCRSNRVSHKYGGEDEKGDAAAHKKINEIQSYPLNALRQATAEVEEEGEEG